jgi:glycosyltransferase involved in cell wall biosynthesis
MEASTHRLVFFAEELVKLGNTVSIVLPTYDRHAKTNFNGNFINGVHLIRPYQPRLLSIQLSTMFYIVSSFLKQTQIPYDVVHVLKPLPITCAPYILKPLKRVPIIQDMDDLDHNVMMVEKHSDISVKMVQSCETILPKLSNQIVTCSTYLKQIYLNMGINEQKITWIPNGVNTSDFAVSPHIPLKKQYALKDKVIVYLGSLNNQAQVYCLIKAMELIVKERKDVSCMIIGDGTYKVFFEKLTISLDLSKFIKFTGRIPYKQVSSYLSVADIGFACFPPPLTSAGGALKIFMYMASGLPVVVNPVGDLPYYIDFGRAGATSLLDQESLALTLLNLIGNDKERRQIGEHARTYVKQNFDWSVLTKRLFSVYKNALSD